MFGDLVRGHRRRSGLSQEELAERAGISVRGLRKVESNQIDTPRPATVRLLADAFALTGDDRDRFTASAATDVPVPERPAPDRSVPAQLPADVAGFSGRAEELRRLTALLDGGRDGRSRAPVVVAVTGTAGVGKTALAVHWAHQVRHRFPDGQLHVNLRGFDPGGTPVTAAEALRGFLEAFAVPPERIPAGTDAQAGLYRSLLATKRVLVVL